MVRVLFALLLVVAVGVAFPWVAAVAGLVVVGFILAASVRGRTRRRPHPKVGAMRPSLERRLAVRRAWQEVHGIEAASGLPPTPPEA
ncbi:MAG TPA: hypothetical protein VHT75_04445 [Acidimicrobiales bacterium]|jgi:hypothetical protein|nr:hypothetical protein [Acidimicrobiales bacterium]